MENANIIRSVRYASENGLVILSFVIEDQNHQIIRQLQNALSTFSLLDFEIVITRSLFDLSDTQHRIYQRNHLTARELTLLDFSLKPSVWISRADYPNHVELYYEWL